MGLAAVLCWTMLVWTDNSQSILPTGNLSRAAASVEVRPLRIGVIPERNIFEQRARFRILADYLSRELQQPVELVTASSYENVIQDFADQQVDVAFLGSLVTVLTVDRVNAHLIAKTELLGGISTYRGVLFVPSDSKIKSFDDLSGKSIALVRTTTAANLFPMYEIIRRGLLKSPNPPKIIWVGTHDDVFTEVAERRADAGAIKDLRLDQLESSESSQQFVRLATSPAVPESALVIRDKLNPQIAASVKRAILTMDSTSAGRDALKSFGAERFVPCQIEEYKAIFDMVDVVRDQWSQTGISVPPPARPISLPMKP